MLLAESLLGTSSTAANYIEDVFSTYLYTGNSTSGGTKTITNSIDLSTKGGMVWIKGRSAASDNVLFDTARGAGTTASNNQALSSNLTTAEDLGASYDFLSAFNTDGFTVKQGGTTTATRGTNYNNVTYASWTFRKQAKFFDVVTYTGNNTDARTISHNLGSTPGCIIVKNLSTTTDWMVWHRSLGTTGGAYYNLRLNTTAATVADNMLRGANSTTFTVSNDTEVNGTSSNTYVAYLFAHDAGGFGASGSDNVISCGSFTTDGSGKATVNLGYEPQFVIYKNSSNVERWRVMDSMRGMPNLSGTNSTSPTTLYPNINAAESVYDRFWATSTGFYLDNGAASTTFIYIAIRRGPMKTPTSGTSVFQPNFGSDVTTYTTNFPLDMGWDGYTLGGATDFMAVGARLLGQASLATASTAAESTAIIPADFWSSNTSYRFNAYGNDCATYAFRRAPGFFDVVCYTGTGSATTRNHNLGAVPQMIILKKRGTDDGSVGTNWGVYVSSLGSGNLFLNATNAYDASGYMNMSATSTTFTDTKLNWEVVSQNYVAYLFATCPGVSKVGSYTGSGTTKQIDCGFTGGARFVLIKRTDSTGDWYLWDSARGIVAGNDPYLRLNSSSAEVTGTDYVDTYSAGFEISSTAPAAINANGGSFIFLAIA